MKNNQGMYALAEQINAKLASLPPEKRPELPNRRRAQSVAYSARTSVEVLDQNGNEFSLPIEQAAKWLNHTT